MNFNFLLPNEPINSFHHDKQKFMKLVNLKMIFPFSVKNLNYLLFDETPKINFNHKKILKEYETSSNYSIFWHNKELIETKSLQLILNKILSNIVNSTNKNNPIFINNNENEYLFLDDSINNVFDQKEINNFSFNIYMNKNTILSKLFKTLNISLSFNKTIKRMSGCFNLALNFDEELAFEEAVDMVYLLSLFKQNIDTQILPLSLENIIEILNDVNESISSKQKHAKKNIMKDTEHETRLNSIVDFKYISFDSLHQVWINLLNDKFLFNHEHNLSQDIITFLKDDFFYSLMFILCTNIYILFELNAIFTNDAPFSYLDELCLQENEVLTSNNNSKDLLNNLLQMIHNNYFHHGPIFRNPTSTQKTKALIKSDSLYLRNLRNNYVLSSPTFLYDLQLIEQKSITHFNSFIQNKEILALFLLILYPENYLLNMSDSKLFPSLDTIYEYISLLKQMNLEKFKSQIKNCLCENTYYYYSFIKNDNVIILQNNYYEQNLHNYINPIPYYIFSIYFINIRVYELNELQKIGNFIEFTNEIRWKNIQYHKLIKDLNDIEYEFDNLVLYMNGKFKKIILKLDDYFELRRKIDLEQEKIRWTDELFKREIERGNFIITFIVAILVGFINYFAQVYSELVTTDVVGYGYPGIDVHFPWIPMTISFSSIAELVMLIILAYAFYRMTYFRRKIKLIDKNMINFL